MDLYYKNETLFVDINVVLDQENVLKLKRRVFRIIDDYDIDRVIFRVLGAKPENMRALRQVEMEYHQKYGGNLVIQ